MKTIIISLIFISLFKFYFSLKIHLKKNNSKRYDETISPIILEDLLKISIDPIKDEKKLFKPCLEKFIQDQKYDTERRNLFKPLNIIANTGKGDFELQELKSFLQNANPEIRIIDDPLGKVACGDYVTDILKPDNWFKTDSFQNEIKTILNNAFGFITKVAENNSKNFITSFASVHRDNQYRNKDMFSKLNNSYGAYLKKL
jgi:hypothetical protein